MRAAAVVGAFCLGLPSCVMKLALPEAPPDPTAVYVLDYGRHAGLLLPRGNGESVEYHYGEYRWFALGRNAWYRVVPTMCWPTPGTLGRRSLPTPHDVRRATAVTGAPDGHGMTVSGAACRRLLEYLDDRFESRIDEVIDNPEHGIEFVPDDQSYWLGRSCNAGLAGWLERLDVAVSGSPCFANFQVVAAPVSIPESETKPCSSP